MKRFPSCHDNVTSWEESFRRALQLDVIEKPVGYVMGKAHGDHQSIQRISDYRTVKEIDPDIDTFFDAVAEWTTNKDSTATTKRGLNGLRGSSAVTHVLTIMARHRIDYSPEGLFCVFPKVTRYRDAVYVLDGCSMPLVLRGGTVEWQVVGEAYVQGIMDGESILQPGYRASAKNGTDDRASIEDLWLI